MRICDIHENCRTFGNNRSVGQTKRWDLLFSSFDSGGDFSYVRYGESAGDGVGAACDNCWGVANADQADLSSHCGTETMPYSADPYCGDACWEP